MSGQLVWAIGFEGLKELIPLTKPVELRYKNQTTVIPILVSEHTPVVLLGRDALCRLNCTIRCAPKGCHVDVPHEIQQMFVTAQIDAPFVFWIRNLSSDLLNQSRRGENLLTQS